jgi:hypothetical protein
VRLVGRALKVSGLRIALVERIDATLRIVTVGFRQQSGWLARPCWSTVMWTTHASSAVRPFGDELSFTVAQPPAKAVLVHASATTAAMMSDFRTNDLLLFGCCCGYTGSPPQVPGADAFKATTLARRVSHPDTQEAEASGKSGESASEDTERFIEEVRGDDPELASYLRIEERELEAGGETSRYSRLGRADP